MRNLVAAVLVTATFACGAEAPAPGTAIEPAELVQRLAAKTAPVILDVRSPEEFSAGHIPGALNVPHTELAGRLPALRLAAGQEIVVHCESGRRAGLAATVLRQAGYANIRDLNGHMRAWRAAGHPLEAAPTVP